MPLYDRLRAICAFGVLNKGNEEAFKLPLHLIQWRLKAQLLFT